ncbi:hypothetical protein [Candidatus Poriferisodalis sp.]|uniref:hypothetical protein n=1 Tax=Candidatus Poriferisodalis sp. TaxID=3101277 RepID=UPI003B526789
MAAQSDDAHHGPVGRLAPHEADPEAIRPADTSPEAWNRLTQTWSSMTPLQRANLAASMSSAIESAARAGIRSDEPDAREGRIRYLLAQRRYGTEIATAAFGPDGRWPQ